MVVHVSHPAVTRRLQRAAGHLQSILKMLDEGRECLEIAQQLQAVEKAILNAKKVLVHDHIDNCLEQAASVGPRNSKDTIREFQQITRYL